VLKLVGILLIALIAVLVMGAYIPSLPYLGAYGSLALSLWSGWVIVVALIGGLVVWRTGRGRVRNALTVIAVVAACGAALVTYRLVALAHANGVTVTIGNAFGFSSSLAERPADEVLTYTRDRGEALALRIYRSAARHAGGSPVLLYVHGGGWVSGSSAQRSADMRWFADHGWTVVSIDYSLSSDRRHMWDRVTEQVGCAMAWTVANIGARGGDASKIALIGDSAGGNLVINAGYRANAGKLESTCGGGVPRVSSVLALYPAVDLVAIYDNQYRPTGPDVSSMARRYIGGSPQQYYDRYAMVASASTIHRGAPPTLIFLTENDHLVPADSVRAFDAKARAAGVNVRTISVPFAEHVFDATGIGAELVRQAGLAFIDGHYQPSTADR
jgi:acetyl esterase